MLSRIQLKESASQVHVMLYNVNGILSSCAAYIQAAARCGIICINECYESSLQICAEDLGYPYTLFSPSVGQLGNGIMRYNTCMML